MPRNPYSVIVDGYLEDYEGGIGVLTKAPSDEVHEQAAEVLCELSRDIIFALGAPLDYDDKYIRNIISLFEKAASHIRPRTPDLLAFQAHIASRAVMLAREMGHVMGTAAAQPTY